MNSHLVSILCAGAFAALMCTPASAETRYTVTDLGTLGGSSKASAINASGDIVGNSFLANSTHDHAISYSGGVLADLGAFPVADFSTAQDINNNGQIVGMSRISALTNRAALFAGGTITDLGTLAGMTDSYAFAINDAGDIVGQSSIGMNGLPHAFLYSANTMTAIGTLPSATGSAATDINSKGQIACATYIDSRWASSRGFIYLDGQVTELGILPGGTYSAPTAINDHGQVVGSADTYTSLPGWTEYHAFLYSGGAMTDLGVLPGGMLSAAFAINNAGVVVGNSQTSDYYHAFIYIDGTLRDLNDLIDPSQGWKLESATGINDLGQIVGQGIGPAGRHAFLLTPIPEPTSLCLFAWGMLTLLVPRRRSASS